MIVLVVKSGDFIKFRFQEDSCWGPKGEHKAFVFIGEDERLFAHYLGDLLIDRIQHDELLYPHFDELEDLLHWSHDVEVIKKPESIHDELAALAKDFREGRVGEITDSFLVDEVLAILKRY